MKRENFVTTVTKLAESVYDFHKRWDLLNTTKSYYLSIQEREELLMEEIRELSFEYNKNDKVLDLGCGSGIIGCYFYKKKL